MSVIAHVVGTRPNYVKAAPLIRALSTESQVVLNTGQHYDEALSSGMISSVGMPPPDIQLSLNRGLGTFGRLASLIDKISRHFYSLRPSVVVVYGDVDSTLAAAIVASRMQIPVIHVESGLRSFDDSMPEEVNRKIVDRLASLHFVTEESGILNLQKEGLAASAHFVGNSMIDSLILVMSSEHYQVSRYDNEGNILMTCHRPSNVDNKESLLSVLKMCRSIDKNITWPIHPRSRQSIVRVGMMKEFEDTTNLQLIDPLNYCDFLKMMNTSSLIITDSGGVQEESTFLKIPCLTIRKNTERPITVTHGSNTLVSLGDVKRHTDLVYNNNYKTAVVPKMWDGIAAVRMAKVVKEFIEKDTHEKNS